MDNKRLTLVIETYNRREELIKQLKSIFRQKRADEIEVVISDNHSDYSVEEMLKDEFSGQNLENVTVVVYPYNTEMPGNHAMCYMHCKTQWMWLLSDDDETVDGSIDLLLNDIQHNNEVAMVKYTKSNGQPQDDLIIDTIDELIDYYRIGKHTVGDFFFQSNIVYNMDKIKPYLSKAFVWGCSYIGHTVPIIYGLAWQEVKMQFSSKVIVNYVPEEVSRNSIYKYVIGFASVADMDLRLNKKQHKALCGLISRPVSHFEFIKESLKQQERYWRKLVYKRVYNALYINNEKLSFFWYVVFMFCHSLNIDLDKVSTFVKRKSLFKRILKPLTVWNR